MRARWQRWGLSHVVWTIGVVVLFSYAISTTNGDRHLPTGTGLIAFLVAAVWTLWIFRG